MACLKSELDLFTDRPVQVAIDQSRLVVYQPVSASTERSIEFIIPRTNDTYRDVGCVDLRLLVTLDDSKLITSGAGDTLKKESVATINNLLHSLFDSVKVSVNGVPTSRNSGNYAYRSYIESLLSYSQQSADTTLATSLFYLDRDANGKGSFGADDNNLGFQARKELLKNQVELFGRLSLDISSINKLLAYGTELTIKLQRSRREFVILSDQKDSQVNVIINAASLYIRDVKATDEVYANHVKLNRAGHPFKYPQLQVECTPHTIAGGEAHVNLSNFINGLLPKLLIIGFVDNEAYNGSPDTNPFDFKHYNYTNLALKVNGVALPPDGHITDFSKNSFARAYSSLLRDTHIKFGNDSHMITPKLYSSGFHLLAFDLTPDQSGVQHHGSIPRYGSVGLDVRFAKSLAKPITVIVYACYDMLMIQDKDGNIKIL